MEGKEHCEECARLRSRLAPLEDADFTADYILVEPVEWIVLQENMKNMIIVRASELLEVAFGPGVYTKSDVARMGRTLQSMGWLRTAKNGSIRFKINAGTYYEQIRLRK